MFNIINLQTTLYKSILTTAYFVFPYKYIWIFLLISSFVYRKQEEKIKRAAAPEKLTFKERQRLFSLASSAWMKVKTSWTETSEGEVSIYVNKNKREQDDPVQYHVKSMCMSLQ